MRNTRAEDLQAQLALARAECVRLESAAAAPDPSSDTLASLRRQRAEAVGLAQLTGIPLVCTEIDTALLIARQEAEVHRARSAQAARDLAKCRSQITEVQRR